ncbi:MAG: hypothetical protein R6V06_05000 [Kiritimatiellia bacterium]
MTEDLQQLLEKIQHDGVEKARTEAESILDEAKKESTSLIASAKTEAEKIKSDAKKEAEAYAVRAGETISQSARDILLRVEKSVTEMMENLLLKNVNTALNSKETAVSLVAQAVKTYMSGSNEIEISIAEKMTESLRAELAGMASEGVTVVLDNTSDSGFRVKLANGRVEHDFTGEAVAEALAGQLRPGLAKYLKS